MALPVCAKCKHVDSSLSPESKSGSGWFCNLPKIHENYVTGIATESKELCGEKNRSGLCEDFEAKD